MPKNIKKNELLWKFAGFFEAEGCITYHMNFRGGRRENAEVDDLIQKNRLDRKKELKNPRTIVLETDMEWSQKQTEDKFQDKYFNLLKSLGFDVKRRRPQKRTGGVYFYHSMRGLTQMREFCSKVNFEGEKRQKWKEMDYLIKHHSTNAGEVAVFSGESNLEKLFDFSQRWKEKTRKSTTGRGSRYQYLEALFSK